MLTLNVPKFQFLIQPPDVQQVKPSIGKEEYGA
jgi:hypothetical protein